MSDNEAISVTELNTYIKSYIENNYFLNDIYVKGEISNFKRHQSGTLYFAIKDEKSAVNVVMFQSYANRLKTSLKDGDLVLIRGKISVYEARGTYSINAYEVIFDQKGMLLIQFEELKNRLKEQGLFDLDKKKPLPKYPNKIGIITAPYGAAIQDMQRTIKSRWPIAQIYLYPSLVQGEEAKYDIVKNIKLADNDNLDVIICGRGGGSIEDLWAFNEEIVALAFFECKTPIISAVGHEIDTTISDYVADARGLTPTDGAIKATPNRLDELENINKYKNNLITLMNNTLKLYQKEVYNLANSYVLTNPTKIYENYRLKIDELENALNLHYKNITSNLCLKLNDDLNKLQKLTTEFINNKRHEFITYSSKLDSLSPLKVLNRGYAFATKDSKIIKNVEDIAINDNIDLSLQDGYVKAKVISKEKANGRN